MARINGMSQNDSRVIVNVYDLNENIDNSLLLLFGFGLFHSGVQIGREEYTFGSGGGIFSHSPKDVPNAKFRESIDMGEFKGSSREISAAISDLRRDFRGEDYHILRRNCNSFSNAFVQRLLGKEIPAYVNRLATVGDMFSCLIPESMLTNAPVDDAPPSTSSSRQFTQNPSYSQQPFLGQGMKLGATSNSSQSNSTSTAIVREDVREMARRAALSRIKT
eukprot:gene28118-37014_t